MKFALNEEKKMLAAYWARQCEWISGWMDGRVDGGSTGIQVPTELDKPLISTRG